MIERESSDLEYKETISNSFLKTVSAFANYSGGKIIFGINDNGETVGLAGDLIQHCLSIENMINDNLRPVPRFRLQIHQQAKTIELNVGEGSAKPYMVKNKAYQRADSSTVEVDRSELKNLIMEGQHINFESLPAASGPLTFVRLEQELKNKLKISELTQDILKTLQLFSEKEGFNKAAELIADKNSFPGIDTARIGESFSEIFDREIFERISILAQFESMMRRFRRYYVFEGIVDFRREDIELIPGTAFREALVNSLVHRRWDFESHTRILMFENRIEIVSPGGLPKNLSRSNFLHGHVSIFRNPILGNILFRLGWIESFGSGIVKINEAYQEALVKPSFKILPDSVTVVLPVIREDRTGIGAEERSLYNLLDRHDKLSQDDISKYLGWDRAKTAAAIDGLIQRKLIQKVSGRYRTIARAG